MTAVDPPAATVAPAPSGLPKLDDHQAPCRIPSRASLTSIQSLTTGTDATFHGDQIEGPVKLKVTWHESHFLTVSSAVTKGRPPVSFRSQVAAAAAHERLKAPQEDPQRPFREAWQLLLAALYDSSRPTPGRALSVNRRSATR